ncbi:hypothetical protein [Cellulosimicrobium composti]|uniref:Uncharacterized protein n=1 Tax=Cellulosimicrobium composti TaxID=2672572 RepID=A0ABX0BGS6_9MICO|nr:hypothetical protein [Cellulosimicrobium composti]NDO90460.1 hypothetical protein [Cellulosimicrobium composti]
MTTTAPRAARDVPLVRAVVGTWPRRVALGVVVGVVASTVAAGGLARHVAADAGPARAVAGEAVATGPFDVTVRSWTVTDAVRADDLEGAGADAWLVVVVGADNADRESRRLDRTAVTLPDALPGGLALAGDAEPDRPDPTLLVRDASAYPLLQPGLPEDVALLWPVTLDAEDALLDGGPDEPLTVTLPEFRYRDMTVGGGRRWAETGDVVLVDVPPGDVPPGIVDPPEDEEDW